MSVLITIIIWQMSLKIDSNMDAIYIDSDALIGLYDPSDLLHPQAITLLDHITKKFPSAYLGVNILLEVLTVISQRIGKAEAVQLLDELRSGKYIIVQPDESLIEQAEMLFREIQSKNISYSDCVSFSIMKKHHLKWVFSFDVDFKKQGFKRFGFEK